MALKLECGYLKGFIGEHEYAALSLIHISEPTD